MFVKGTLSSIALLTAEFSKKSHIFSMRLTTSTAFAEVILIFRCPPNGSTLNRERRVSRSAKSRNRGAPLVGCSVLLAGRPLRAFLLDANKLQSGLADRGR